MERNKLKVKIISNDCAIIYLDNNISFKVFMFNNSNNYCYIMHYFNSNIEDLEILEYLLYYLHIKNIHYDFNPFHTSQVLLLYTEDLIFIK